MRSFISILISTSKNLYDTFYKDIIIEIPADESALDNLESVLRLPIALEYFFEFIQKENNLEK